MIITWNHSYLCVFFLYRSERNFQESMDQGSSETRPTRKSARVSKQVTRDTYDMYSPYSDDSLSYFPDEKSSLKKSKSIRKKSTRSRRVSSVSKSNKPYNQRKDVIFKRILRGCRKYYFATFTAF